MYKVLVFAGTTEGYEICRFLADHKIETKGFVATEYGSKSLTENEFLTVQTGRLDAAARATIFGIDTVVLITRTISSTESTPSGNHGTTRQSEEDGTLTTRFGSHIHRFAVGNIHVIGISYFHFSFDFFYFASGFGGHHFLLQLYNTAPKKR